MKELVEKLKIAFEQVQESNLYQTLEEKYVLLTPKAQKAVHMGALAFALLIIMMPVYSFYASSRAHQKVFVSDRQLMRELLQVASRPTPPPAPGVDLQQAQQMLQQLAENEDLLPEQMLAPIPQPATSVNPLSKLKYQVFELPFKQLTLTQLVNLGQRFDSVQAIKLTGLEVQASTEDPHYYDVRFQLVHFEWPKTPPSASGSSTPGSAAPGPSPAAPKKSFSPKGTKG